MCQLLFYTLELISELYASELFVFFFLSPIPIFLEGIGETHSSEFPLRSLSQVIHSFPFSFDC